MLTNLTAPKTTTDNDMQAIKETASRTGGIKLKGGKSTSEKIDAAANEFESQFVAQMLGTMFSTVDPHESLGGSDSEEVYQSMLTNEYGKLIARTGGIGVADQVKRMMINQQEVK